MHGQSVASNHSGVMSAPPVTPIAVAREEQFTANHVDGCDDNRWTRGILFSFFVVGQFARCCAIGDQLVGQKSGQRLDTFPSASENMSLLAS
jgi:hypothetical protein